MLFTQTVQTKAAKQEESHRISSNLTSLLFLLLKDSPSEASTTALLPLFVKTEIMKEQNVSSYYTALCLSKNTRAAPQQLTTHSQLSNAAEPPKRPLLMSPDDTVLCKQNIVT